MMKQTFVVHRRAGNAWVQGTPVREQPLWDEHAAFMDKVFEQGQIILAGPYTDGSGALLIVETDDELQAQHLFDDDPWTLEGILSAGEVKAWQIFLRREG